MKLCAVMIARNEDWCIGMTLRAALEWCDFAVVLDHGSTDNTPAIIEEIAAENPGRMIRIRKPLSGARSAWEEMHHRQETLDKARILGATHIAIVDADELITANLLPTIRQTIERECRYPSMGVALPMVATWNDCTGSTRRIDGNWGEGSQITLAFMDAPWLTWTPAEDGYQHHQRQPHGVRAIKRLYHDMLAGGVFHFQFISRHRLEVKADWYKMLELVHYPEKRTPAQLNAMYDWTLQDHGARTMPIPDDWWVAWATLRARYFRPEQIPWQLAEACSMMREHGPEKFAGLMIRTPAIREAADRVQEHSAGITGAGTDAPANSIPAAPV